LPKTCNAAVDKSRVSLAKSLIIQSVFCHYAWPEIFNNHIAFSGEFGNQVRGFAFRQVEGTEVLPSVLLREVRRYLFWSERRKGPTQITLRWFDFYNFGSLVSENPGS
tara:strand:- start:1116 stop:1439 length:324 start_codon:yes stop_codon:yes gene_type:complete